MLQEYFNRYYYLVMGLGPLQSNLIYDSLKLLLQRPTWITPLRHIQKSKQKSKFRQWSLAVTLHVSNLTYFLRPISWRLYRRRHRPAQPYARRFDARLEQEELSPFLNWGDWNKEERFCHLSPSVSATSPMLCAMTLSSSRIRSASELNGPTWLSVSPKWLSPPRKCFGFGILRIQLLRLWSNRLCLSLRTQVEVLFWSICRNSLLVR